MKIGLSLIDRASKMCGSDSKLAEMIGVHRVAIAEMRNGKRRVTPETAAEMASAAGEDAREAALQMMIENAEGTRREGVLREILGKGLALGVAGLLVFSYSGESISKSISETKKPEAVNFLYIVECHMKKLVYSVAAFFGSLISPQAGPLFDTKTRRPFEI